MFVGVVVLTTVLELIASYIMQAITGGWLWDYTSYSFSFQGRIALNPSIRFGLGGILFLYLLQPLFRRLSAQMPDRVLFTVSGSLAIRMLLDTIYTFFLKQAKGPPDHSGGFLTFYGANFTQAVLTISNLHAIIKPTHEHLFIYEVILYDSP